MCFVDFKKAFDSISHDKLWVTKMDMGYPLHVIDLLAKLYRKQLAEVKVAGTLSEWFRVKKGDLEKEIMQGTMPGARGRGKPRTAWMDNIKTWTGLFVEESVRMT